MDVTHFRIQHGVGQGSFHSATVQAEGTRFDYVYDCGARAGSGKSKELKRNIDSLGLEGRANLSAGSVLDVLVLSHYDADHLNGMQYLSTKVAVQRVFVPYLSPDELAFVIASQANAMSSTELAQLHGLAHGSGTLWGIAVTMVLGGDALSPDAGVRDKPSSEPSQEPEEHSTMPRGDASDAAGGPPKSVRLGISGRGTEVVPVPKEISDVDDVMAQVPTGQRLWKLRFWNRKPNDVLVAEIRANLEKCGFPLDKLDDPAGTVEVGDWIDLQKNRKLAVRAYDDAIKKCGPSWAHEASGELANLLSLAMYAGPDFDVTAVRYKRIHESISKCECRGWGWGFYPAGDNVGWLGTGDAPLGEASVWSDFARHYANEIPKISTYLVPHHGAAPKSGAKFYNSGLNHSPGVASVISYGTANHYGHPTFSVRAKIVAHEGEVYCVTEKHDAGFQELIQLTRR